MSTQAKLGSALFDGLIRLRDQKGTFTMEDVGGLFMQVSARLHPSDNAAEAGLKEQIEQLAMLVEQAKREICSIDTAASAERTADSATVQLDAVVKATEEATQAIMDVADTLQAIANDLQGERQQAVAGAITKIYEACNFQDLTGQRIGKVVKILGEIDLRINNMLRLFGAPGAPAFRAATHSAAEGDAALLNGPQLPDQAPSQTDIDALFAGGKS
jgi:chemotaxis protein CheZ